MLPVRPRLSGKPLEFILEAGHGSAVCETAGHIWEPPAITVAVSARRYETVDQVLIPMNRVVQRPNYRGMLLRLAQFYMDMMTARTIDPGS